MAKCELIDKKKLIRDVKESNAIDFTERMKFSNVVEHQKPITEEEIVKPYLEKLKAKFEGYRDIWDRYYSEYESGRYESYDICIDDIEDMINLLTEKGVKE